MPSNRIDQAIARLDLATKVRLLTGATMFSLHAEPRCGLAELRLSDGPTGVRGTEFLDAPTACLLPNATLLAQHWDAGVAAEVGSLLADEALAQRIHVVLGPTINLHRSPLGGRLFESYSEDPLLTGALAVGYVRAMQHKGIGATAKHFLANESETERATVDSVVDERTLREVYLLPFEMLIAEAPPWAVMASYNRINGVPATEHAALVAGLLKSEWGSDGLVVSDWYAARSTVACANGGLDLVMPGPEGPWGDRLAAAIREGDISESTVDDHLSRLLLLADRVGGFGTEPSWPERLPRPDSAGRRRLLRNMAAGGMTVLTNRAGTLPLPNDPGHVLVVGRHAVDTVAQGGGSAQVHGPHVVHIGEGISAAFGPGTVRVLDGVEVRHHARAPTRGRLHTPGKTEIGMRVTARDDEGSVLASSHVDGSEVIVGMGGWLDGASTVVLTADVVTEGTERMLVGVRGLGAWSVHVDGRHHTVHRDRGNDPGEGVLFPPGWTTEVRVDERTTITATVRCPQEPTLLGLLTRPVPAEPTEVIDAAAPAASHVETAIVVVGLTQEQDTEGADKTTLALPGQQDALVSAVAAAAPRTVVVVNAATPVLMPWLSHVDAVLFAGLPGQEAGDAVAAALLGEIEPAGRLVTTFPADDDQGPVPRTVPDDGVLEYTEGRTVGYRAWDEAGTAPLFWFGHGLGYTTWEYTDATVHVDDAVRSVRVTVHNTGTRTGREVVQAYLRPATASEPIRLIGWAGVRVRPGESTTVEVPCDERVQRVWHPDTASWSRLPPRGAVVLARGLGDVRVRLDLE